MSAADSGAGGHLSLSVSLSPACPYSPAANDCRWVNAVYGIVCRQPAA